MWTSQCIYNSPKKCSSKGAMWGEREEQEEEEEEGYGRRRRGEIGWVKKRGKKTKRNKKE